MAGLKNALQALNNAVKDLTSLHVQTFTGDIKSEITGDQSYDDIRQMVKAAKEEGTIHLVAETLAQFDGDSYNFVVKDMENVPEAALDVHKNAVDSGIETRVGLLNLFKDLID